MLFLRTIFLKLSKSTETILSLTSVLANFYVNGELLLTCDRHKLADQVGQDVRHVRKILKIKQAVVSPDAVKFTVTICISSCFSLLWYKRASSCCD